VLTCGLKLTHDGCVAVVDDDRLLFSIEIEKLSNNARYSKISDLSHVAQILGEHGLRVADIDRWYVDGWDGRESGKIAMVINGMPSELRVAGYCEASLHGDPGEATVRGVFELDGDSIEYMSSPHVASHWSGAYWASPFARAREEADILVWDGGTFPRMYRAADGAVQAFGEVFPLFGHAYALAGFHFGPFVRGSQPGELWVAGKLMAYIAKGRVDPLIVKILDEVFTDHFSGDSERARYYRDAVGGFGSHVEPSREATEAYLADVRTRVANLNAPDDDVLTSFHHFLERKLVMETAALVEHVGRVGAANLCIAGGCALNIKWNSALRRSGTWSNVWVPPFCNDTGSAIGAAVLGARQSPRSDAFGHLRWSVRSGPALVEPAKPLDGWSAEVCGPAQLARHLHETGEPVVVLNGRAELGPRALGGRSILAPAISAAMKDHLNAVKEREDYRPIAPVCLESMLFDHELRPGWRDRIPAVMHLDGTSRLQTVGPEDDPVLFEVLSEYHRISGIPVLCNTSANHNGRGFFPDVRSAMEWGRVPSVWSGGHLYRSRCPAERDPGRDM
jgi:carbamoyltransferase